MKDKIKKMLIRLVAKKVINKVGKEKWEASKGKIGAVVATLVYIVNIALPAFGVDIKIPEDVIYTIIALGFGTSLYGIREAQERTEDEIHKIEENQDKNSQ